MRRKKSSLSTYLVIVGLFYGGLYLALDHFAAGPEPEGVADVEWIELGAAPLGQPEPSSSPEGQARIEGTQPLDLPPREQPAPTEGPPPLPVAVESPAPVVREEPESLKAAWTDPEGSWDLLAAQELEASQEVETIRPAALQEEDFFPPTEDAVEVTNVENLGAHAVPASSSAPGDGTESSPPQAGPNNPYRDPHAPPIGRHGVLDATSLKAAGGHPPPSYPTSDRLARREGTVVLLGFVTPEGRLSKVTVEQEASSAMTQESYRTFKSYRYQPGQTGWVRQTFRFTLKGAPQEIPGTLRGA